MTVPHTTGDLCTFLQNKAALQERVLPCSASAGWDFRTALPQAAPEREGWVPGAGWTVHSANSWYPTGIMGLRRLALEAPGFGGLSESLQDDAATPS